MCFGDENISVLGCSFKFSAVGGESVVKHSIVNKRKINFNGAEILENERNKTKQQNQEANPIKKH